MKDRNLEHSDNWATPKAFYDKLDKIFHFDFNPCPYNTGELEFDGLKVKWGQMNYVNPPYSLRLKEAFIRKAIEERDLHGSQSLFLLPVSTSTKIFHDVILPNSKKIEFLKGRLRFIGVNTKGEYVNWDQWDRPAPEGVVHVKNSGMFDSMLVLF